MTYCIDINVCIKIDTVHKLLNYERCIFQTRTPELDIGIYFSSANTSASCSWLYKNWEIYIVFFMMCLKIQIAMISDSRRDIMLL